MPEPKTSGIVAADRIRVAAAGSTAEDGETVGAYLERARQHALRRLAADQRAGRIRFEAAE